MDDTTPHLKLPLILPAQAQKHVTHNEALRRLDALVMLAVRDRDLSAPPAAPREGDCYLVKGPGSGTFADHDGDIAHFVDGAWDFYPPAPGWVCYVADEDALTVWNGAAWSAALATGAVLQNLARLGLGTTADAANPFLAKLNTALWTATPAAEGGSGDLRCTMNKESTAGTVSLLLQSGYTGRAEIGLTGDDRLHLKVSPDGTAWRDAMVIDANGNIGIGTGRALAKLHVVSDATTTPLALYRYGNPAALTWYTAGGTEATATAVGSGGQLGVFGAFAHNGTGFSATAVGAIRIYASENHSPTAQGSAITIETTPNGSPSTARVERLRIDHSGNVGIGTATPTCALDVNGPVRAKSYIVATLPAASICGAGAMVYVADDNGGAVIAFSDGVNWRRVTDRSVVG